MVAAVKKANLEKRIPRRKHSQRIREQRTLTWHSCRNYFLTTAERIGASRVAAFLVGHIDDFTDSYVRLTQEEIHDMAEKLRMTLQIYPDVQKLEDEIALHQEGYAMLEDRLSTIEAAILEQRQHDRAILNYIGDKGEGILGVSEDKEGEQ